MEKFILEVEKTWAGVRKFSDEHQSTVLQCRRTMTEQHSLVESPWAEAQFATAWQMVPLDVRLLLQRLAERPEGYPLKDLMEKEYDTFEPGKIRGLLSEVNSVHKQFPRQARLFHYNRKLPFKPESILFWMNPQVAELIRSQPKW
jgi:hypothetical protein